MHISTYQYEHKKQSPGIKHNSLPSDNAAINRLQHNMNSYRDTHSSSMYDFEEPFMPDVTRRSVVRLFIAQ
jgi:hypothetical protein